MTSLLMIKSLVRRPCFGAMFSRLPLFRKSQFYHRRRAAARHGIGGGGGCRPSGAERGRRQAGGKGLPVPIRAADGRRGRGRAARRRQRAARGKGSGTAARAAHGSQAADGRQGRTGRQAAPALTRRGGTGRKGERGRADGKRPVKAKGGACAARLHGKALGKRKTPLAAGLVRLTGRRGIMPAGAGAGRQRGFDRLDRTNGKGRPIYQSKRQAGAAAPAATV